MLLATVSPAALSDVLLKPTVMPTMAMMNCEEERRRRQRAGRREGPCTIARKWTHLADEHAESAVDDCRMVEQAS